MPVLLLLFPTQVQLHRGGICMEFQWSNCCFRQWARPYSLVWNTAGPYTVNLTVTENGCVSALSSQPVTINAIPDAAITATPAVCVGQNNSISFSGTANPGANYVWTFGSGTVNSGSGQDLIRFNGLRQVMNNWKLLLHKTDARTALYIMYWWMLYLRRHSLCRQIPASILHIRLSIPDQQTAASTYTWNFGSATVLSGTGMGPYLLTNSSAGNAPVS